MTDAELREEFARRQALELRKQRHPWLFYRAHEHGQLQFHQAPHINRCLWPGNGFGKTTAGGIEAAWWLYHAHPYHQVPSWPLIVLWCAETYKQFEILRQQLEQECLGPARSWQHPDGWKFNKTDHVYQFPRGDKLFLLSADGSWQHVQGINPDLVLFDEQPPQALFNEMRMRRRGKRKTRYCFMATATQGLTWMYHELYQPWLKWHTARGMSELDAVAVNDHPMIWAWPLGGIRDNPGADAGDVAYYEAQTFTSDAERRVRLRGGFADFAGKPVFDIAALERMEPACVEGEIGSFTQDTGEDGRPIEGRYTWIGDGGDDYGQVRIFEHPRNDTSYVLGFDSAYGLVDGDFDYAVVLDRATGVQVAEAQGHWGDAGWAHVIAALHWYYRGAFICGERQVGLVTMRRLYDEMGVTYQYFNRDEAKRSRRRSDTLGHHRQTGDLVIRNLRKAIAPRNTRQELLPSEVSIRSKELLRQAIKYQFAPRSKTKDEYERKDKDFSMGAPAGDHDDGVSALTYANLARLEVEKFELPAPDYGERSYARVFNMAERLGWKHGKRPKPQDPYAQE